MRLQLLLARVCGSVGRLATPCCRGNSVSRLIWARARPVRFVVVAYGGFPRPQLYILLQKPSALSPKMVTKIRISMCRPQSDRPESTTWGGRSPSRQTRKLTRQQDRRSKNKLLSFSPQDGKHRVARLRHGPLTLGSPP